MKKETNQGNLEVYLIRHGKTRNARGDELLRDVRDFPINVEGIEQCENLKRYLANRAYTFDRVYSSPIRAAQETADKVFGEGNYIVDERLTKHSHGDWENKGKDDVYTEHVRRALESDPYNWHAPNGESQRDIEERVYDFVEEKRAEMPRGGKIAVVTHGVPIITLIRKVLGVDSKAVQGIELENTSLTRFDCNSNEWKVVEVNEKEILGISI